jgi:hypothetical protein
MAKFGSVEPDGFEGVDDPNAGVILPLPGTVLVDVRPGGFPNPLNGKSNGVILVAIVGTPSLDVTAIDPDSVRVEGVEIRNPIHESS